jgi:suppressor of fused-like protein
MYRTALLVAVLSFGTLVAAPAPFPREKRQPPVVSLAGMTWKGDGPDVSGWGFELTMRLPRPKGEKQPTNYAINFLFNLGRYVRRSRNPLGSGHLMDLNGPICLGADTAIRAVALTTDPQLGEIQTPNGSVEFIQAVGVTMDEYHACGDWQTARVLEILRETNPLLITDLARRSAFEDPAAARRLQEGIGHDGSQSDREFVSVVEWSIDERTNSATATLGAKGVQGLLRKLRSRLLHGRDFMLIGREKVVALAPADEAGWRQEEGVLVLNVTPDAVGAMMKTLRAARGTYAWAELPGFALTVVPSEITNPDGEVIEVIG